MTSELAVYGGAPAVKGGMARYNSIGEDDVAAVSRAITNGPLSGFLGGRPFGGPLVQRLEQLWAVKFKVQYAIACNSATSGLLAACAAAGIGRGDLVATTPTTMSATSAAPKLLGASLHYCDVEPYTFTMWGPIPADTKAVVITNLFGAPGALTQLRMDCDRHHRIMIEDNAQAPLAMENGQYAGTIGHLGVFSLNVHKHLQCGEGGVVVTNDSDLAQRVRNFINHGELAGDRVGLNLRMTEVTAAIAITQLNKIEELVFGRVTQAHKIINALADLVPWLKIPMVMSNCTHVYYMLPFTLELPEGVTRDAVVKALNAEGFPLESGYVEPLYHNPAFNQRGAANCPVAEDLYRRRLITFSNCEWSPSDSQIQQFAEAVLKVDKLVVQQGVKVNATV